MTARTQSSVVITGVSSGIGAATATFLSQHGYHVFGSVRKPDDAARLKESLGAALTPLIFDVCDARAVQAAAADVAEHLGNQPLRALVNNAGIAAFGPLECLDDGLFERSLQVNVAGTRLVTNAFLPLLRGDAASTGKPGTHAGTIINMSSLSGIVNTPVTGAYCVAKHALESLGEVYRRELLPQGIDVVSIRSGPVRSSIWEKNSAETASPCKHNLYDRLIAGALRSKQGAQQSAIPGEEIAALILDILQGRKHRSHYEVSKGAIAARLMTYLPERWLDRVLVHAMSRPG